MRRQDRLRVGPRLVERGQGPGGASVAVGPNTPIRTWARPLQGIERARDDVKEDLLDSSGRTVAGRGGSAWRRADLDLVRVGPVGEEPEHALHQDIEADDLARGALAEVPVPPRGWRQNPHGPCSADASRRLSQAAVSPAPAHAVARLPQRQAALTELARLASWPRSRSSAASGRTPSRSCTRRAPHRLTHPPHSLVCDGSFVAAHDV